MPQKHLLSYTGLPEGEKGYYNNKQHQHGKENNQGLPTRFLLRTGSVEYSIRPPAQTPIYKTHKSRGLCRRLVNNGKSRISWGSRKYSQRRIEQNHQVGER